MVASSLSPQNRVRFWKKREEKKAKRIRTNKSTNVHVGLALAVVVGDGDFAGPRGERRIVDCRNTLVPARAQ